LIGRELMSFHKKLLKPPFKPLAMITVLIFFDFHLEVLEVADAFYTPVILSAAVVLLGVAT
jgi:hypothetical protein